MVFYALYICTAIAITAASAWILSLTFNCHVLDKSIITRAFCSFSQTCIKTIFSTLANNNIILFCNSTNKVHFILPIYR